jgi:hypothetical protein
VNCQERYEGGWVYAENHCRYKVRRDTHEPAGVGTGRRFVTCQRNDDN